MSNNTPVYWTMSNGTKIDVDKMDINHLRNTLKMLIRKHENKYKSKPRPIDGIMANFEEDMINEIEEDLFGDHEKWFGS